MDTSELDVGATPKNLVTELALSVGKSYYLQVTGSAAVYIARRTAVPPATAPRHRIAPGGPFYFDVGTRGIWVWSKSASQVTVSETA